MDFLFIFVVSQDEINVTSNLKKVLLALNLPLNLSTDFVYIFHMEPVRLKLNLPESELAINRAHPDVSELTKKTGKLWECIARTLQPSGGYIYQFKLKPEFDTVTTNLLTKNCLMAAQAKSKEIFPALEIYAEDYPYLELKFWKSEKLQEEWIDGKCNAVLQDSNGLLLSSKGSITEIFRSIRQTIKAGLDRRLKIGEDLRLLGFKKITNQKGVYLFLPDCEELKVRFGKLSKIRPNLGSLHITSSEGIASDMDFVKAYMTHDGLLSEGAEFMHDHSAHILPLLYLKLESESLSTKNIYEKSKKMIVNHVRIAFDRIINAEKGIISGTLVVEKNAFNRFQNDLNLLKTGLGIVVDRLSAINSLDRFHKTAIRISEIGEEILEKHFATIWTKINWKEYIAKRYTVIDPHALSTLWQLITAYENDRKTKDQG